MMKLRLSAALLLLALMVTLAPAAFAQDQTFGLSSGDFDLWTMANHSSMGATSAAFNFTAKVQVANIQKTSITADLTGSGAFSRDASSPQFQLDVTGTLKQNDQSSDVNLGLRLVDGNLYFNSGEGWQGGALSDVVSLFSQGFVKGSGISLNPSDLAQNPAAVALMTALTQLNPSDFVAVTRSDANGLADFTVTLKVDKLLASPALGPIISGLATSGAATPEVMTDAQIQQTQQLLGVMFSSTKITLDQFIDPTAEQVQRDLLDINMPLDNVLGPGALLTLNFDINLSNYGQPVTVEVPASAQMLVTATAEASK